MPNSNGVDQSQQLLWFNDNDNDHMLKGSNEKIYLAETLVGLSWEAGSSPTSGNTLESLTLGDTNNVDLFAFFEERLHVDSLFEESVGVGNLIGNGSTVDLDFHKVSLLLSDLELADLRVSQNTDNSAVLLDAVQLTLDELGVALDGLLVLGEGLLLGAVPVLVEATENILAQVVSPDGGEGTKSLRSFDVSDNTNNNNWWGFQDGDSFDDLFLVDLCNLS